MTYRLHNKNNREVVVLPGVFDLIYCDVIYEDKDLSWLFKYWNGLKDTGIFIVQTDWHTVADYKILLDNLGKMVNWCIYINDWGGTPRKGFPNKHDDILIYSKTDNWKWDKSAIEIPKVTAGTKFDKKGTGMKTPCDVFYDHASFSTMTKERVKTEDGHNIKWQKPQWLMDRLVRPFTIDGDFICDPYMGSGSLGEWCELNNREYEGIELDVNTFKLAENRLKNLR